MMFLLLQLIYFQARSRLFLMFLPIISQFWGVFFGYIFIFLGLANNVYRTVKIYDTMQFEAARQ